MKDHIDTRSGNGVIQELIKLNLAGTWLLHVLKWVTYFQKGNRRPPKAKAIYETTGH